AEATARLAEDLKAGNALELAEVIAARSAAPAPFKPLAFAVWTRFPDTESQALFNDLLADDRVTMLPGPAVAAAKQHQQLLETLRTLARTPESAASMLAAAVPPEEEAVVAPAISAADADVDQVYEFMERDPFRSYRASELCQEVLETFPGSRSYQ